MLRTISSTIIIIFITSVLLVPLQAQVFYLNNSFLSTPLGTETSPFTTLDNALSGIQTYINGGNKANITLYIAKTLKHYPLSSHLTLTGDPTQSLTVIGLLDDSNPPISSKLQDPFSIPLLQQQETNYTFPEYCWTLYPQILSQSNQTSNAGSITFDGFLSIQFENLTLSANSLNNSQSLQPVVLAKTRSSDSSFILSSTCGSILANRSWSLISIDDFTNVNVNNFSLQFFQQARENKNSQGVFLTSMTSSISLSDISIYLLPNDSSSDYGQSFGTINLLAEIPKDLSTTRDSQVQVSRLFSQAFIPQFHIVATHFTLEEMLVNFYQTSPSIILPQAVTEIELSQLENAHNLTIQKITITGLNFWTGLALFFTTSVTPSYTHMENIMFYDNLLPCTRLFGAQFLLEFTLNQFSSNQTTLNNAECPQFRSFVSVNRTLDVGSLFFLVRRFTPTAAIMKEGGLNQEYPYDVSARFTNLELTDSTFVDAELVSLITKEIPTPDSNVTNFLLTYYEISASFVNLKITDSIISSYSTLFSSSYGGMFFSEMTFERNIVTNYSNLFYFVGSQMSFILENSQFAGNYFVSSGSIVRIENTAALSAEYFPLYEIIHISNTDFIADSVEESDPFIFSNVFSLYFENCRFQPQNVTNSMGYIVVPTGLQLTTPLFHNRSIETEIGETVWKWMQRTTRLQDLAVNDSLTSENQVWNQFSPEGETNSSNIETFKNYFLLPVIFQNVSFWGINTHDASLVVILNLSPTLGLIILDDVVIGNITTPVLEYSFIFAYSPSFTMMNSLVTNYYGQISLFSVYQVPSISIYPQNTWNFLYNMTSRETMTPPELNEINQIRNREQLSKIDPSKRTHTCDSMGIFEEVVYVSSQKITNFIMMNNTFININLANELLAIDSLRIEGNITIKANYFANIDIRPCTVPDQVYGINLVHLDLFYTASHHESSQIWITDNYIGDVRIGAGTQLVTLTKNELFLITSPKMALNFQRNVFKYIILLAHIDSLLEFDSMLGINFSDNEVSFVFKGVSPVFTITSSNMVIENNTIRCIAGNMTDLSNHGVFLITSPTSSIVTSNIVTNLRLKNNTFDTIYMMMHSVLYTESLIMNLLIEDNVFTRVLTHHDGCMLCFEKCTFVGFNLTNTTFNGQLTPFQSDYTHMDLTDINLISSYYTNFLNVQESSGNVFVERFNAIYLQTPVANAFDLISSRMNGVLFAFIDYESKLTLSNMVIDYNTTSPDPDSEIYDIEKVFSVLAADSGDFSLVDCNFSNIRLFSSSLLLLVLDQEKVSNFNITNCNFKNLSFEPSDIYKVAENSEKINFYTELVVARGLVQYKSDAAGVFFFEESSILTSNNPNSLYLVVENSNFTSIHFDVAAGLYYGSCIMLYSGGYSNLLVRNTTFIGVYSYTGPDIYSQLNVSDYGIVSDIKIYNTTFLKNTAEFSGGVIYNTGSKLQIGNSTIQESQSLIGRTSTVFTKYLLQWPENVFKDNKAYNLNSSEDDSQCTAWNFTLDYQGGYEIDKTDRYAALYVPASVPQKPCGISPMPHSAVMYINHTRDGLMRLQGPNANITNASADIFSSFRIVVYIADSLGRFFYEPTFAMIRFYRENTLLRVFDCAKPTPADRVYYCNFTQGFQYKLASEPGQIINYKVEYVSLLFGSFNVSLDVQMRPCEPGELTRNLSTYLSYTCERCPTGTFSLDPSSGFCAPCLNYATCPGGDVIDVYPQYSLVYLDKTGKNVTIEPCPNDYCLGGPNSSCKEGYQGQYCMFCDLNNSYIGNRDKCDKCTNLGWNIALLSMMLVGIFCYHIYYIIRTYQTNVAFAAHTNNELQSNSFTTLYAGGVYLRLLTTYSQIISVVLILKSKILLDFGYANSLLGSPTTVILTSSLCVFVLDPTFNNQYILYYDIVLANMIPFIKIGLLWSAIAYVYRKETQKRWPVMLLAFNCIMLLEQPGVFKSLISYFSCERSDATNYIHQKTGTYCYDFHYYMFRNWFVYPSLLFWGILLPGNFLLKLFLIREELKKQGNMITYGAMYCGYRKEAFWWEVMLIVIKILINMLAELLKNDFNALSMTLFIGLYIYYYFFSRYLPYETRDLNDYEKMTFRTYMITIFASLAYNNQDEASLFWKVSILGIIVFINLYTMGLLMQKIVENNFQPRRIIRRTRVFIQSVIGKIQRSPTTLTGAEGSTVEASTDQMVAKDIPQEGEENQNSGDLESPVEVVMRKPISTTSNLVVEFEMQVTEINEEKTSPKKIENGAEKKKNEEWTEVEVESKDDHNNGSKKEGDQGGLVL